MHAIGGRLTHCVTWVAQSSHVTFEYNTGFDDATRDMVGCALLKFKMRVGKKE